MCASKGAGEGDEKKKGVEDCERVVSSTVRIRRASIEIFGNGRGVNGG